MKLENHVIFITGGASGIGLAIAKALVDKNVVVISGRSADKLAAAKQAVPALHTIRCDVNNAADTRAAIDAVVKEHGRLSVWINNAGVLSTWDMLNDNDAAHMQQAAADIATNFTAPIQASMLVLPTLLKEPQAAIVNVTSGLAYAPIGKFPVYCATKAALHSFSKSLRHQLEKTHVKVFDVLPPGTATELAHDLKGKTISVDVVAKETLRGIAKDHFEIPIGQSKTLEIMERIAPGFIEQQLLRAED